VAIDGFVEQVVCSPRACLLSFEAGWSGLVAIIPAAERERFPDPQGAYARRTVRVRGVVEDRDGRLRIEIGSPSKIEVISGGGEATGSQVLSTQANPPIQTGDPAAPRPRTQVHVSGGLGSGTSGSQLGEIVNDLREEAATTATAGAPASELAVRGLRERVAIQSQTIQALESELGTVRERLGELEQRPAAVEQPAGSLDGVPRVEPWVVPARRGLAEPRPRTGWSIERLVREVGSPLEVLPISRDRALWKYGDVRTVTVARGRVVSVSGF